MRLTEEQLAHIAARADEAYCAAVRPGRLDRVDVMRLARVLGYRVALHRLSTDGSVCGLITPHGARVPVYDNGRREYVTTDGHLILIERALRLDPSLLGVLHYTTAHELAHGLMADFLPAGGGLHDVGCAGTEPQADRLAARLLMPERLVVPCLAHFALPKRMRSLNDELGRQFNFARKFEKMAQYLQVSQQALSIRLHDMGVLRLQPAVQHRVREACWDIFPEEGEWIDE